MIIGAAVGGAVALVLFFTTVMIVVLVFASRRRAKTKKVNFSGEYFRNIVMIIINIVLLST